MTEVEREARATPVVAREHRVAVVVTSEHLGMALDQRRVGSGEEGSEPQARLEPRLADPGRERCHARGEVVVRAPVADASLPTVVDLEHVEGHASDVVEHFVEPGLGDAGVERVPAAPDARMAWGAAAESVCPARRRSDRTPHSRCLAPRATPPRRARIDRRAARHRARPDRRGRARRGAPPRPTRDRQRPTALPPWRSLVACAGSSTIGHRCSTGLRNGARRRVEPPRVAPRLPTVLVVAPRHAGEIDFHRLRMADRAPACLNCACRGYRSTRSRSPPNRAARSALRLVTPTGGLRRRGRLSARAEHQVRSVLRPLALPLRSAATRRGSGLRPGPAQPLPRPLPPASGGPASRRAPHR